MLCQLNVVFVASAFLVFFISDPTLLYQNIFFLCTLPYLNVWPMNSETPCILQTSGLLNSLFSCLLNSLNTQQFFVQKIHNFNIKHQKSLHSSLLGLNIGHTTYRGDFNCYFNKLKTTKHITSSTLYQFITYGSEIQLLKFSSACLHMY